MKPGPAKLLASVVFALFAVGLVPTGDGGGLIAPPAAQAQNFGQRVVQGFVSNATETPVVGATVFLKNLKSKSIRSYTTEGAGKFYFAQVNMSEDYDLWAEKDGKKTPVKTVSSWDTRKQFETELRFK